MDSTTNFKTTAEWLYEAAGHMYSPDYQTRAKKNSYDPNVDYPIFKKISAILKEFLANTPKELLSKKTCSGSAVSSLQSKLEKMGDKQTKKMNVEKIQAMAELLKATAAVADQVDNAAYTMHLENNPDKAAAIHLEAVEMFKAQEKMKRQPQKQRIENLLKFMVEGMQGAGLAAPEAVDELEANKRVADWIRVNNRMEPNEPALEFSDIQSFGLDAVLAAMQITIKKEESKIDADVDAAKSPTAFKKALADKRTEGMLKQAKIDTIRATIKSSAEVAADRLQMLNRNFQAQDLERQLMKKHRREFLARFASRAHYANQPEISRTSTSVSLSVISTSSTSSVGSDEGSQQSSGVMRTDSTDSVPSSILSPKIKSPTVKSPVGSQLKSPKGASK